MEKKEHTALQVAEEHISNCATSGMTQVEYCNTHGIKKATFAYWMKRRRDAAQKETVGFIPINTKAPGGLLEVQFANGTLVRFEGVIDIKYLKELIR